MNSPYTKIQVKTLESDCMHDSLGGDPSGKVYKDSHQEGPVLEGRVYIPYIDR